MRRRAFFAFCATFLVCCCVLGQNTRSAVSVNGNDMNPCNVPSPCRTFSKAITVTNSGGEIIALDSGGYGPFGIDRAVTVRPVAGAYAGIAPGPLEAGINVFAGSGDDIVIRGINISGQAGSYWGIRYVAGSSLTVQDCTIDHVGSVGIISTAGNNLTISNTTVTNCGNAGIQIGNGLVGSPTVFATISDCTIDDNPNHGVAVYQTGNATIANSVIANNDIGLIVYAQVDTLSADVVIERSTISGNREGIESGGTAGTAIARVSNCTISHNFIGADNAPGNANVQTAILSRQNNTLQANSASGSFSGTFPAN